MARRKKNKRHKEGDTQKKYPGGHWDATLKRWVYDFEDDYYSEAGYYYPYSEKPKPLKSHAELARREKVVKAWRTSRLRECCTAEIKDFYHLGKVTQTKYGAYIYRDNGTKVLMVAHLDSVTDNRTFSMEVGKSGIVSYYSTSVDDRAGAFVILDLLPRMGIITDVLLTEGEESGRSTANFFETSKQYNWIASFDRAGQDVVMYQYETSEYEKLLKRYGFVVGIGSYSDIASMEDLKVTGFNFGTGYYDNHTSKARLVFDHLVDQVTRFSFFYDDQKDVPMPYDETKSKRRYTSYVSYGGERTRAEDHRCEGCGAILSWVNPGEYRICYACKTINYFDMRKKWHQVINECPYCNEKNVLIGSFKDVDRYHLECKACKLILLFSYNVEHNTFTAYRSLDKVETGSDIWLWILARHKVKNSDKITKGDETTADKPEKKPDDATQISLLGDGTNSGAQPQRRIVNHSSYETPVPTYDTDGNWLCDYCDKKTTTLTTIFVDGLATPFLVCSPCRINRTRECPICHARVFVGKSKLQQELELPTVTCPSCESSFVVEQLEEESATKATVADEDPNGFEQISRKRFQSCSFCGAINYVDDEHADKPNYLKECEVCKNYFLFNPTGEDDEERFDY